jgi:hypothetical protein
MATETPDADVQNVKVVAYVAYRYHVDPEYKKNVNQKRVENRRIKMMNDPEYKQAYLDKALNRAKTRYQEAN